MAFPAFLRLPFLVNNSSGFSIKNDLKGATAAPKTAPRNIRLKPSPAQSCHDLACLACAGATNATTATKTKANGRCQFSRQVWAEKLCAVSFLAKILAFVRRVLNVTGFVRQTFEVCKTGSSILSLRSRFCRKRKAKISFCDSAIGN